MNLWEKSAFKGTSKAAERRKDKRLKAEGIPLVANKEGAIVSTNGTRYFIDKNGSMRRCA